MTAQSGNAAIETLRAISALPAGWDGGDSPPLQSAALAAAIVLAESLGEVLPEPHVAPVRGGGVQFGWHCYGTYLEVEVRPNGQILYLLRDVADSPEGSAAINMALNIIVDAMQKQGNV